MSEIDTIGPWLTGRPKAPTCVVRRHHYSFHTQAKKETISLPKVTKFDQKALDQLFKAQVT